MLLLPLLSPPRAVMNSSHTLCERHGTIPDTTPKAGYRFAARNAEAAISPLYLLLADAASGRLGSC